MNAAHLAQLRRLEAEVEQQVQPPPSQWDEMTPDEVLAQYRRLCRSRRGGP